MGLTRFYARRFEGGADAAPEVCYLTDQESQHGAKVLRLRVGDAIEVTDGEGALYKAVLTAVDVKCCEARIEEVLATAEAGRRPRVRIVMAPTKQTDRMEWFLEKATEMGTGAFGFVQTHHTERDKLPADRMEKILVSAMKQSLQRYKPQLEPLCTWCEFMARERAAGAPELEAEGEAPLKCIAYCGAQYPRVELAALLRQKSDRLRRGGLTVLIGPEGDFTPEEVAEAVESGYIPVLLGPNRLRAETAALYAACAAQLALL